MTIRLLGEADLDGADRVFRLAFGTYLGIEPPEAFAGDADYVRTRWRADPSAAFAADSEGAVVGSVFATNWGRVGFFGPLTVRPDFWDQGVGSRLLEPVMERFDQWGIKNAYLYTFADSPKHLALYQKFGFWPRFLTILMTRPIVRSENMPRVLRFSECAEGDRAELLDMGRELTGSIHQGLDLSGEIQAVAHQGLGDTLFLLDRVDDRIAALAVCHLGAGTEAGSGTCYIKFAAVRPGSASGAQFDDLLNACEGLGKARGATQLLGGINTAQADAYQHLLAHGFRTWRQGITMHRPNEPGLCRPGVYMIGDWR